MSKDDKRHLFLNHDNYPCGCGAGIYYTTPMGEEIRVDAVSKNRDDYKESERRGTYEYVGVGTFSKVRKCDPVKKH